MSIHELLPPGVQHAAGFRLFAAFWGSLVAVDVGRTTGLPVAARLACVAVVVAAVSIRQGAPVVLAAAVIGWLFATGFIENSAGQLRVRGPGDLVLLLGFAVVAWAATTASAQGHR